MKMKKIAVLLLAVCLMVSNFTMLTQAADGKIMFTDPSTAVGETLELKGVVTSSTDIEDRTVEMTYDTTMLKFKNGNNVTETEAGKLVYKVTGQKDGNRVEFLMYFDVLKEGTTEVKAVGYQAWDSTDATINCQMGYSSVKIAAGEVPTVDPQQPTDTEATIVEVNGVSYTLSGAFANDLIPEGFVESSLDYAGAQHRVLTDSNTGMTLGYLVDESGAGKFFLYNADNATFAPYEQIAISDTTTIILLSNVEDIVFPEEYTYTTIVVNDSEFPAWQNAENPSRCILYALDGNGEEAFYQYDSLEDTYQRFELPAASEEPEEESLIGTVTDLLENHLNYVVLGAGLGFILFVLIIIILSVKLYNRNAELDELYDELGIDMDDEEEPKKSAKKSKKHNDDDDDKVINFDDEDSDDDFEHDDNEEDNIFENIAEEIEDDIMLDEVTDEEVEVEFFEQFAEKEFDEDPKQEELLDFDDIPGLREMPAQTSDYFDDEDDIDFEMDFIDLDD